MRDARRWADDKTTAGQETIRYRRGIKTEGLMVSDCVYAAKWQR